MRGSDDENLVVIELSKKELHVGNIMIVILTIITLVCTVFTSVYAVQFVDKKNKQELAIEETEQAIKNYEEEQARIAEEKKKEDNRFIRLNEEEIGRVKGMFDHSDVKRVFLTFDDGPTKSKTEPILDILKKENVKASFFVLGSRAEYNPEIIRREYNEGHFIANHGYSHDYDKIYESVDACIEEFEHTNRIVKQAIGNENFNTLVFRFPGGSVGGTYHDIKQEIKGLFEQNGVGCLDWNALTKDAEGAKTKEAELEALSETAADKSSVVLLMHDASDKQATVDALPEIIKYFKDNGYEFQTLYDVIGRE